MAKQSLSVESILSLNAIAKNVAKIPCYKYERNTTFMGNKYTFIVTHYSQPLLEIHNNAGATIFSTVLGSANFNVNVTKKNDAKFIKAFLSYFVSSKLYMT